MSPPSDWHTPLHTPLAAAPPGWLDEFTGGGVPWAPLPLIDAGCPPPDPRPIERAASELPLYDGLIAIDPWAAQVLLDRAGGALPRKFVTAAVGVAAQWLLREYEIEAEVVAADVAELAAVLGARFGRQERLLAPVGSGCRLDPEPLGGVEIGQPVAYGPLLGAGAATALGELRTRATPSAVLFTDAATVDVFCREAQATVPRASHRDRPPPDYLALDPSVADRLRAHDRSPALVSSDASEINAFVAALRATTASRQSR